MDDIDTSPDLDVDTDALAYLLADIQDGYGDPVPEPVPAAA
jgi:hypothetical protein